MASIGYRLRHEAMINMRRVTKKKKETPRHEREPVHLSVGRDVTEAELSSEFFPERHMAVLSWSGSAIVRL